jgi:hypothetical protein
MKITETYQVTQKIGKAMEQVMFSFPEDKYEDAIKCFHSTRKGMVSGEIVRLIRVSRVELGSAMRG